MPNRPSPLSSISLLFALVLSGGLLLPAQASEKSPTTKGAPDSGHELLDKAVRALGPLERFDRIRSVRFFGTAGEGAEASRVDMWMAYPKGETQELWMHVVSGTPEAPEFERRLAGSRSWARNLGALPPDLHQDAVRYASTKLLTLLHHRNHPATTVKFEGREIVEGEEVDVVAVTLLGTTSYLEIAAEGRVRAIRFLSSPIQEETEGQVVRRSYGDYRQVGPFEIPFHQKVTVSGEAYSQWQLEKVEIDPPHEPAIFEAPE